MDVVYENWLQLLPSIVLIFTLIALIWQVHELKKSTRLQAHQSVLNSYMNCINECGEPLYKIYFPDEDENNLKLLAALLNTFEMLYVQKDRKLIDKDVWDPWEQYFIKVLRENEKYRGMWEGTLREKGIYHNGLVKIIDNGINNK